MHNESEKKRKDGELKRWRAKIDCAVKEYYEYKSEVALSEHAAKKRRKEKDQAKKAKVEGKSLKKEKRPEPPFPATMMSPGDLKSFLQSTDKTPEKKKTMS